jgi:hypothetical protein
VRRTLWPLAAFGMAFMVAVIGAGCGGTQSNRRDRNLRALPSYCYGRRDQDSLVVSRSVTAQRCRRNTRLRPLLGHASDRASISTAALSRARRTRARLQSGQVASDDDDPRGPGPRLKNEEPAGTQTPTEG